MLLEGRLRTRAGLVAERRVQKNLRRIVYTQLRREAQGPNKTETKPARDSDRRLQVNRLIKLYSGAKRAHLRRIVYTQLRRDSH